MSGFDTTDFPFVLDTLLGKGAYAEVWSAHHVETGERYAVKCLKHRPREHNQVEKLLHEVRIIARSSHPNILQVFGAGRASGTVLKNDQKVLAKDQLYLIAEYLDGGTLEDKVGNLPPTKTVNILRAILKGLGRVHARGVLHLDLKPSNILLSKDGRAVLADFGISRMIHQEEQKSEEQILIGTPYFMAPEQTRCHEHLFGPWTDLYALGCLAYMLITGKPPFTASHIFDVLAAQQQAPFPKLGEKYPLGTQLDPWFGRLTAKAHNRRFQRANEALEALNQIVPKPDHPTHEKKLFSPSKTVTVTQLRLKAKQVDTEGTQTFLIKTPQAVPADEDSDLTQTIMISPTDISSSGSGIQKGFGAHLIAFEDCSLVGRETEQKELWQRAKNCFGNDESHLVSVHAPPGFGKSVLCEWLTTKAHEELGADVVWINHHEAPTPFDGVPGMLYSFFKLHGVDRSTFAQKISERLLIKPESKLCEQLSDFLAIEGIDQSTVTTTQLPNVDIKDRAIVEFFAHLASLRPLVVVVDDLQWAFPTARIVSKYCQDSKLPPVFFLTTVRSSRNTSIARGVTLINNVNTSYQKKVIKLNPLSDETVSEWFGDYLPNAPAKQLQKLVSAAQGSPLTMKALVLDAFSNPDDRQDLAHPSLDSLILRRYQQWQKRNSSDADLALQLVVLLGQRTSLSEWLSIGVKLRPNFGAHLIESSVAEHFVELNADRLIQFRHARYLEVVFEAMRAKPYFKTLNLLIAQHFAEDPSSPHGRVARHFKLAGRFELACEHYILSSDQYREQSDYERTREALYHAARSLRMTKRPRSDRQWYRIGILWVLSARVTGRGSTVVRRINRLCAELDQTEFYHMRANAYMEKARLVAVLGYESEVIPNLRYALAAATHSGKVIIEDQLRLELVDRLLDLAHLDESNEHLDILRKERAEGLWDTHPIMFHLQFFKRESRMARLRGEGSNALAYIEQAKVFGDQHPSIYAKAEVASETAQAYACLGQFETAETYFQRAEAFLNSMNAISVTDATVNLLLHYARMNQSERGLEIVSELEKSAAQLDEECLAIVNLCRGLLSQTLTSAEMQSCIAEFSTLKVVTSRSADALELLMRDETRQRNPEAFKAAQARLKTFWRHATQNLPKRVTEYLAK